jgi:prolyl 4-hydroxylase
LLSPAECDHLIAQAFPRIKRSIAAVAGNKYQPTEFRISQNTWLEHDVDSTVSRLIRRMHDVTGLNMSTAESLQVANYGLAGMHARAVALWFVFLVCSYLVGGCR